MMTDILETVDERAHAEKQVARALKALEMASATLENACDAMKAALGDGDQDVVKELRTLNTAFLFAMNMQEKAIAAGSERFGSGGAGVLDLDAARDEIGVRLACLRDARGTDGVSGQPE